MENFKDNEFYKLTYKGSLTIGRYSSGYFDIIGVPEKVNANNINAYGIIDMGRLYDYNKSDINGHINIIIEAIKSIEKLNEREILLKLAEVLKAANSIYYY